MTLPTLSGNQTIFINRSDLRSGYQQSFSKMEDLKKNISTLAVVCPSLSFIWAKATGQLIRHSPVSLALLAVGAIGVANQSFQYHRMHTYTRLSFVLDENGPTNSDETNQKLKEIFQRSNPEISDHQYGIFITKAVFNSETDSAIKRAKKSIASMNRVPIPSCVLNKNTDRLVKATHDRWRARLAFPLSILNLVTIIAAEMPSKNNKKRTTRKPDDYVVATAAAHNIYNYLSGPSVSEVRDNLTSDLNQCRSVESLLQKIIEENIIDSGAMSFLKEWAKNMESLGARVDRTGNLILYRDKERSFGGPYPLHRFPANTKHEK